MKVEVFDNNFAEIHDPLSCKMRPQELLVVPDEVFTVVVFSLKPKTLLCNHMLQNLIKLSYMGNTLSEFLSVRMVIPQKISGLCNH